MKMTSNIKKTIYNIFYYAAITCLLTVLSIGLTACNDSKNGNSPQPEPGTPNISVSADKTTLQQGDTVTFTVTGSNIADDKEDITVSGNTHLQDLDNQCTVTNGNLNCTIMLTNKYTGDTKTIEEIIFTASDSTKVTNSPISITLEGKLTPSISVSANPISIAKGGTVTFTVTGSNLSATTTVTAAEINNSNLTFNPNNCGLNSGNSYSCTITAINNYENSESKLEDILFSAAPVGRTANTPITLQGTSTGSLPNPAIVGYIQTTDNNFKTNLTTAASKGYNVFVVSFVSQCDYSPANSSAQKPESCNNNNGNSVQMWGGISDSEMKTIISKIKKSHSNIKVLATTGGDVNLFMPDLSSETSIETAAQNMADFLKEAGFDGLDFDIEHLASTVTVDTLNKYITKLKLKYNGIITAAPQIATSNAGTSFVPADIFSESSGILAHLDYVFVQTYNQRGGAAYENYTIFGSYVDQTTKPNSVFLKYALKGVKDFLSAANPNTKFILGVPSYVDSTCYTTNDPTTWNTTCTKGAGNGLSPQLTKEGIDSILKDSTLKNDFIGIMTWDIGNDAQPTAVDDKPTQEQWDWITTIKPVVNPDSGAKQSSDIDSNTNK